uniref:Third variable lymphocyte receptor n=1 Tax=Eptatretus stoutii TaxID=7765 RepID=T1YTN8_EPTST|nr:third variable lymphocyte receptor [Eptatretus stoutii]
MERWFSRITMFWMLFLGEVQSQDWTKCSTGCTCDGNKMSVTCNGLKNVPNDIQKDAKKLDLKYNSLSKLSPTAFHGMKELTYLGLEGNKLQALPAGVFDQLVELDRVQLGGNQLKFLPSGIFDKLTKLTYLTLSTNQLRSVPQGVFDSLSSLSTISLEANDWDCASCDILYLSQWIRVNSEKVKYYASGRYQPDPDGVTCQGTMESVNKITKENTFQAGCPTTTQQMATSPASTTTTETMTVREKQTKPRMKIFQEELFSKASIFFCQVIFTQHVSLVVIHILAEIPLLHIVCVVRKP